MARLPLFPLVRLDMASNSTFTVNLTKEAFDRLCAIRDALEDLTGEWTPLNVVCSSLICQIQVEGVE